MGNILQVWDGLFGLGAVTHIGIKKILFSSNWLGINTNYY